MPPSTDPLSRLLSALDARLGSEPYALMRVGRRDWEARTLTGVVGRGDAATDACADLLEQLGELRHDAGRVDGRAD